MCSIFLDCPVSLIKVFDICTLQNYTNTPPFLSVNILTGINDQKVVKDSLINLQQIILRQPTEQQNINHWQLFRLSDNVSVSFIRFIKTKALCLLRAIIQELSPWEQHVLCVLKTHFFLHGWFSRDFELVFKLSIQQL